MKTNLLASGIGETRVRMHAVAQLIAEAALRGEQPSAYMLGCYRDLCTDLRDMAATNDELCPGGAAWTVFGGAA